MMTELILVSNALTGMIYSALFALFILVIATQNWILAIYSTICVVGIVISTLGSCKFMGWDLGINETIACTMVIGLSVDYVIHLCNGYIESPLNDRNNRMKDSLKHIGVSVFGGAITTFGSGCFLLLSFLTFFYKMGAIICFTIFFSLCFSTLFFSATCHLIGPNDE